MKKIGYGLLVVFFVLGLVACQSDASPTSTATSTTTQKTTIKQQSKAIHYSGVPTLFFHGYGGGTTSFGSMLQRLARNQESKKELTLTVLDDGSILAKGQLSQKKVNPTVQVIFQSNKSTQWNQSQWIAAVLSYLKTRYHIDTVNLVGHSMGAVSTVDYLERQKPDETQPQIKKVLLIAGPFNEFLDTLPFQSQVDLLTNGPAEQSVRYQQFVANANRIDQTIAVEVISGQLNAHDLSDGTVPLSSSLAIVPLLRDQGIDVDSRIVQGEMAQHSQLHENKEVDELVSHFLWY